MKKVATRLSSSRFLFSFTNLFECGWFVEGGDEGLSTFLLFLNLALVNTL